MEEIINNVDIKWPESWLGFKVIDQAAVDAVGPMSLPSATAISGPVWITLQDQAGNALLVAGTVVAVKFTAGKVKYSVAVAISPQPKEGVTLYAVVDDIPSESIQDRSAPGAESGSVVMDSINEDNSGLFNISTSVQATFDDVMAAVTNKQNLVSLVLDDIGYAVETLKQTLETLKTNEPISREAGNVEQADQERLAQREIEEALARLGELPAPLIDTMIALVENAPVFDGDVPSKCARDALIDMGYAMRTIKDGEEGYQVATEEGIKAYLKYFGADSIHEAQTIRKARSAALDAVASGLTRKQKIDHIVLNVPNMAKISYKMYFGKPEGDRFTIEQLQAHARRQLETDFMDIDVLYSDVEGNEELIDPLPGTTLDSTLDSAISPIERLKLVSQLVKAKAALPAADGPLARLKLVGEINRLREQLGGTAVATVSLEDDVLSDDPNSPNYRYRDTGDIAGSRKELAAANIRSWAREGKRVDQTCIDWESLEKNPREAKELITKSNLFGLVDWSSLRESGMEPAAGFLIDRVYAAIAPEPSEDTPSARRDYTLGLQSLRDRLEACTTVAQVMSVLDEMRDELRGTMFKPEDADMTAALRQRFAELATQIRALKADTDALFSVAQRARGQQYAAEYEVEKRKRRNWAPKPELDQGAAEAKAIADQAWDVWSDKLAEQRPAIEEKEAERRDVVRQIREIEQATIARNVMENPATRAWAIMGNRFIGVLNYRSDSGSDAFRRHVVAAKQGKVQDWSWADKDKEQAAPKVSKKTVRFQLKVIDKYVRTGGRQVSADSTAALKSKFGLREVQSGNWVLKDPVSAKFHVESAAAAFADLADLIGVDDSKVAMNGRLAMAFGARGRGNAGFGGAPRAHYESVPRVMNFTKMGGGGCLAHEWFHGLDNMVSEAVTGLPGGKDDFVTSNPHLLPEGELRDAIIGLRSAMLDGVHQATEVVEYTAGDYLRAQHNLGGDVGMNQLRSAIKHAADVHEAVAAIDKQFAGRERPKDKKLARDWRRIAVAWHGANPEGGSIEVKGGPSMSSFALEAARLDPGSTPYWSKPEEMAARAFQSWCEDRLASSGRRNDYLSALADNKHYFDPLFGQMHPYPEGEERERINAAFDRLFAAMKSGKTLDSIAEMLDAA